MSKRKVHFNEQGGNEDDDLERAFQESGKSQKDPASSRFKEKHSLDSDEEDQPEKYNVLDVDDIEGQENTGVDVEEGIRFTPFNMEEEMQEGHFDTEGTYIFKKEKEIRDNWMDNIDWVKIKTTEGEEDKDSDSDQEEESGPLVDEIEHFKQMVEIMKEGETVTKALKRLGGGKTMSSAARWKAKKQKTQSNTEESAAEKSNKENLLKLTGLADQLLQQGNFEIYQHTYEKIKFKIKAAEDSKPKVNTEGLNDDDALDMFADSLDKENTAKEKKESGSRTEQPSTSAASAASDEVLWEYKWKEDDSELHGPFNSSQMLEWQEGGFFKDGALVRKVNAKDGKFYSSRRIDFDLYT